jgi:hypothetical protein
MLVRAANQADTSLTNRHGVETCRTELICLAELDSTSLNMIEFVSENVRIQLWLLHVSSEL